MVARSGVDKRHVVPRWRSVRRTIQAGEFQRRVEPTPLPPAQVREVSELEERWEETRNPVSGIEFAGALAVAGRWARAHEVGEALAGTDNRTAVDLAARLSPGIDDAESQLSLATDSTWLHNKVAAAKLRTRRDARSPIAWSDLARRYMALGELEKAERALRVARSLAPESRYLLRAAARFYLHIGAPDQAVWLLRNSDRSKSDPWLSSALLAVEGTVGVRKSGLRVPRRILEDDSFQQIERAELASELATIELEGGGDRRARGLFERSLLDPTDNSLAQVEWASRHLPTLEVSLEDLSVPFTAEAHARSAAQDERWEEAVRFGLEWIDDQPFDTEAATFSSYAASVGLEDWETAAQVARVGLRAKPSDRMLVNNLAFALLESGDLIEPASLLSRADVVSAREGGHVALLATTGLLDFRRGDPQSGRDFYRRAVVAARRAGDLSTATVANSMLLREELRVGTTDIGPYLRAIAQLATSLRAPGARRVVERSLSLAETAGHGLPSLDFPTIERS